MRRTIFAIVILLVAVWIGIKISADPGQAIFIYQQWSVEMPLWFALIGLLAVTWLFYLLMNFVDGIRASYRRWKNWLQWRRKNKAYSKTHRGLLALIEGHWRYAETSLVDGIDQVDSPLINYLAAAKAAHEQGAFDKRDNYLHAAHEVAPQAEIPIGITQATFQLQQGQFELTLATLNHLFQVTPYHREVLRLLERVYIHLGDWHALLAIIPNMRKAKLLTPENLDKLTIRVYIELLRQEKNTLLSLADLQSAWSLIPRNMQRRPELVAAYAQGLLRYPEMTTEVATLLVKSLQKNWHRDVFKLYGSMMLASPQKQLAYAEKWLKTYPNDPVVLLTMAKLSMRCQLWGQAKSYFQQSLKLAPSLDAYVEYGKYLERMQDNAGALQYYQEGLALALQSPRTDLVL